MGKSARSIKKEAPKKIEDDSESYATYSKSELLNKKNQKTSSNNSNRSILRWTAVLSTVLILLLFTGFFSPGSSPGENTYVKNENLPVNTFTQLDGAQMSVLVYSSPSCNCCALYVDYLNSNGFEAFLKRVNNLNEIKDNYLVPEDQRSCHTAIFGDYFIEGHIPLSVVYDLLSQNPDIDGIALPGMPLGSPGMGKENGGMGGDKNSEWVISSVLNGQVINVFARV